MKTIILIGTGGFIGTIFRYLLSEFIQSKSLSSFPLGTLCVNIIGCLVIGIVFAWSERTNLNPDWRLFLATGICGGFTTFSAFTNETFSLFRDGQLANATMYILASVVLGLLATVLGYSLFKLF